MPVFIYSFKSIYAVIFSNSSNVLVVPFILTIIWCIGSAKDALKLLLTLRTFISLLLSTISFVLSSSIITFATISSKSTSFA